MPLLSVIVPAYNVEGYIDACIESICATPSSSLEVICVDDGSVDGTADLLDAWAERDGRVRIIHKSNGGVSSARNAGIAAAGGDYICFVDADDRLAPDGVDVILSACKEGLADAITFSAAPTPRDAASQWLVRHIEVTDCDPAPFTPDLVLEEGASPFVWARSIRRALVVENDCWFDEELSLGEDFAWLAETLPYAQSVASRSTCVYEYRLEREGSLMTQQGKGSSEQLSKHVGVVERVFDEWERRGFLERWPAELTCWAMRFCGYAVLRCASPERDQLVVRLKSVFKNHLSDRLFSDRRLRLDVAALLGIFETSDEQGRLTASHAKAQVSLLVWRLCEYGLRDLVETVFFRGGSRSGSGE